MLDPASAGPEASTARPGGRELWRPPPERAARSQLAAFADFVAARLGRRFPDYAALHAWSIDELGPFWKCVVDFCGVRLSGDVKTVLEDHGMPDVRWFEGARLSFAEHLLSPPLEPPLDPQRTALIFESEDAALRCRLTYEELRAQVARCAAGLRRLGVRPGDRVAALTPNVPQAVVAMLATTALGAVWSSCSPDFGARAVVDRFGGIEPKVLFAADGYIYNGKRHALEERLAAVLEAIPAIRNVIVYALAGPAIERPLRGALSWEGLLEGGEERLEFETFPFSHPACILFTSGTTGKPKCLIHGAGGTLLKHLEEHRLQLDLKPTDVFFYFTTCGWMMWNWLVSGLASGATLVLYDGSPARPRAERLFELVERYGVTVFGTSPRYLSMVEQSGYRPAAHLELGPLRTVLSTGAPLHASQFEWVYDAVKRDVHLASISGGTDLIGCFVLGAPTLPVHAGEIQCRALGMAVQTFDESGRPVVGAKGELVCSAPFPSMPLGFWNDPGGHRYRAAYFERFPGHWHHGDFMELTERGSVVIYGRSDATLNPGGVRLGTAEIYGVLEGLPEIADAIATGVEEGGDVKILLFVVLAEGVALDEALRARIREAIRRDASPRHVPAEIHPIDEVPRTISGKPVEIAVARVLRGEDPGNRDALANPAALDAFRRRR